MSPVTNTSRPLPETLETLLQALDEKKVEDVIVLDVAALAGYTDFFVIVSGRNAPHVQTLAETAAKTLKKPNQPGVRQEGDQGSRWVLIDGGDFVLHIFQPEARGFYALEDLWSDAPKIAWPSE